jgi:hypothetical protein
VFFVSETRKEIQMSDLKRVLMKRKEITSDEAGRFNQGGNAKPNISRSAGTKKQHAYSI